MSRSLGLLLLLAVAILAQVVVIAVTRPVRVDHISPGSAPEPTAAAAAPGDAGSLDSMLDAIRVEHGIMHGR